MTNSDIRAAQIYHEVTKHSYTSVRSNPHALDWENRPLPFKIYPTAPEISLPRELMLTPAPTLTVLNGQIQKSGAAPLNLATISRLLFCADGITCRRRVGGENYYFRAAPSAGALYPIELYLAVGDIAGLAPGLYHFSPADLKLRELRQGDWRDFIARAATTRESISHACAVVIMSSIFWRSVWKYRARAYRYCFWDAGTILAHLIAVADAEEVESEIITTFEDGPLENLIGVDGEREGVVCLATVGRTSSAPSRVAKPEPLTNGSLPLSPHETTEDDLIKIHRASRLVSPEEVELVAAQANSSAAPLVDSPDAQISGSRPSLGLGETILRRGSTRMFSREEIGAEELRAIMATSKRHVSGDLPMLVDTYLIVNAVEGMQAGAYHYDRKKGVLDCLKAGNFRNEAGYLSLEQALGADSSALICYMANIDSALTTLGNRGYRDIHLEAGILGGRAYLAAYALGRGATGLTFYDDDTTDFFSPHATCKSPLLMVAVGVPARSKQADSRIRTK
jgi:SagB-type dehydrogenase family enzyme